MPVRPDAAPSVPPRLAIPSDGRTLRLARFAQALRRCREAYARSIDLPELTVEHFATMMHVSPGIYRRYESGTLRPDLAFLVRLRRRTGLALPGAAPVAVDALARADEPAARAAASRLQPARAAAQLDQFRANSP